MAANIEIRKINGAEVASYVENGKKERAWHGLGQEIGERGTAMWALNGLTTYFQNERNYRNEEMKLDSVLQGHAASKLQQAYDLMIAV